jgi:hypothetical protein
MEKGMSNAASANARIHGHRRSETNEANERLFTGDSRHCPVVHTKRVRNEREPSVSPSASEVAEQVIYAWGMRA